VQANRTATLNVSLKVGQVGTTIDVEAAPAHERRRHHQRLRAGKRSDRRRPAAHRQFHRTGHSFSGRQRGTPSGTGVKPGLGNQPIWANGQRDTSNTFLLNGVDASNLFNGKSTSSVASARIVNNTGVAGRPAPRAAPIQSTASPYLAIGQALPSPAPETVQELRVNTSMYDAQQGSTSGAHIDMSTASGTNSIHGSAYVHRGTDCAERGTLLLQAGSEHPSERKVPQLHRYTAGRHGGRTSHQRQAVRLRQLPAHPFASDLEIGTFANGWFPPI
jgi:hypothetical protein